jgi:hypothetical protein
MRPTQMNHLFLRLAYLLSASCLRDRPKLSVPELAPKELSILGATGEKHEVVSTGLAIIKWLRLNFGL